MALLRKYFALLFDDFGPGYAFHRPLQLLLASSRPARLVRSNNCPQHRWYSASWLQQRTNYRRTERLANESGQFNATLSVSGMSFT
jgi:hypothetical protein